MSISRRDLTALLPVLALAQQTPPSRLPSAVHHSGKIPYQGDAQKKGRRFFFGNNRNGYAFEMHETILGPGTATHEPHRHEHEELVIIVEGTVEVSIDGRMETAEAGSVVYFASNQLHNARNAGETPCRYYVLELRGAAS